MSGGPGSRRYIDGAFQLDVAHEFGLGRFEVARRRILRDRCSRRARQGRGHPGVLNATPVTTLITGAEVARALPA